MAPVGALERDNEDLFLSSFSFSFSFSFSGHVRKRGARARTSRRAARHCAGDVRGKVLAALAWEGAVGACQSGRDKEASRVFCSLSCVATNRAARPLITLMLSPDQARLRAAIVDRGLTLTDVADACGVTRGAVGQWFINGPNGRSIPERHMATIRRLLTEPNATTGRFK
jgi:hypothetical protein